MEYVPVSGEPAEDDLVWETRLVVLDNALCNGIIESFELSKLNVIYFSILLKKKRCKFNLKRINAKWKPKIY